MRCEAAGPLGPATARMRSIGPTRLVRADVGLRDHDAGFFQRHVCPGAFFGHAGHGTAVPVQKAGNHHRTIRAIATNCRNWLARIRSIARLPGQTLSHSASDGTQIKSAQKLAATRSYEPLLPRT